MSKQLNYAQQMDAVLQQLEGSRPRLLLHACCGPCSSAVLEQLCRYFEITVLYYNPNGGSIVNMRAGASLSSSIIGIYAVGTQATVLERGTDWCHVTIGTQTGYVSTYFLR